jgi:hypothetical protein
MRPAEHLQNLPPAIRRVAAITGLAVALLVLLGLSLLVTRLAGSQDAWRERTRSALARDRGRAELIPHLNAELQRVRSAPIWTRFYAKSSGVNASVQMQGEVAKLGSGAGLLVKATSQVPAEVHGALGKLTLRMTATAAVDQLERFLRALRTNAHVLRVERLTVTAPQDQVLDANAVLAVTLDITGYERVAVPREEVALASR